MSHVVYVYIKLQNNYIYIYIESHFKSGIALVITRLPDEAFEDLSRIFQSCNHFVQQGFWMRGTTSYLQPRWILPAVAMKSKGATTGTTHGYFGQEFAPLRLSGGGLLKIQVLQDLA